MQEMQVLGLITRSGRSPGEGSGNSHHYFCLENSMDREAWQATVAKSWTQLSDWQQLTIHLKSRDELPPAVSLTFWKADERYVVEQNIQ